MRAIDLPCETCAAPAGEPCSDQTDEGFRRLLPHYHAARVDAALAQLEHALLASAEGTGEMLALAQTSVNEDTAMLLQLIVDLVVDVRGTKRRTPQEARAALEAVGQRAKEKQLAAAERIREIEAKILGKKDAS